MLNPSVSEIISHARLIKFPVNAVCFRRGEGGLEILIGRGVCRCGERCGASALERVGAFCGRDGSRLERAGVISKRCPECGSEYFPRLNPAIVVLVKRGDEALLVHARNFRGDMMALVAGFVETGETLEECVVREIKEETTLDVRNVRYIGSQSWPFPHQLMIGFTADYAGGEIDFADGELSDGRFFSRDRVPELPTMPSLSRRIIDLWIEGKI